MRPKLLLLGDSITEFSFAPAGWGAALSNLFSRRLDVVLRGLCGYNTRWALLGIEAAVEGIAGAPAAAATVFLGANDAALVERECGYQHVPVGEYRENLRAIYEVLKKQWPSTIVIFITPPPIDEEGRIKDLYPDDPTGQPERTNEAAGIYADACVSLAKELNTPFIDIYTKMQTVSNWQKSLLSDGLHFSDLGNKFMFDELVEKLKEVGLSEETLPMDLPLFLDIDPKNPAKSFSK